MTTSTTAPRTDQEVWFITGAARGMACVEGGACDVDAHAAGGSGDEPDFLISS
jgi:hypothetical protein